MQWIRKQQKASFRNLKKFELQHARSKISEYDSTNAAVLNDTSQP
jgi:hypothetical protein